MVMPANGRPETGDDRVVRLLRKILRRLERIEQRPVVQPVIIAPQAPAPAVAPPPPQARPNRHSADFRTVHWNGVEYHFSPNQGAVVKSLWEAWESGVPDLSQAMLLEAADSQQNRLSGVFRDNRGRIHPAWDTLIVSTRRGIYRLDVAE